VFLGHTITLTFSLAAHRILFLAAVQLADQGLAVFFLISGFLLYRPFLNARVRSRHYRVADYARRRVLRIVPAYWLALSVLLLLGYVSGVTSRNWWIFYGFGQVYSINTIVNGLGVAWTLCVEVTFYAALPVFALAAGWLARRRGGASVGADTALLILLSIGALVWRGHFNSLAQLAAVSTLPGMFVWFALGMGLAVASVRFASPRLLIAHPGACWTAAAAGSLLLYVLIHGQQTIATRLAGHLLYGVVAMFVLLPGVFGEHAGGWPRRVLRNPGLAWIGLISYAFYLYHSTVIEQVEKHFTREYFAALVISAVLTTACAAASYYLVERPIMRLGRRRRRLDR
jgi:peptidoglycan/LPS O-acetylase OafA/YrhL